MSKSEIPLRQEGESDAVYRERLAAAAFENLSLARIHGESAAKLLKAMGDSGVEDIWLVWEAHHESKVSDRGPFILGFATTNAEASAFCKKRAQEIKSKGQKIEKGDDGYLVKEKSYQQSWFVRSEIYPEKISKLGKDEPISVRQI